MISILKREIKAYFVSPLGYVFIGALFFFSGYYFFTYNLYGNTTDMSTVFSLLFSIVLFLVPILTMRLLSEERRSKTEQTLLTAPVSRLGIVLGKYFAALLVYLVAISSTLIMAIILEIYSSPDWPVIFGNFIGLFLLGACLIAICLFISSITESQVIAAVMGFGVSLFLILMDALFYVVRYPFIRRLLTLMSFNERYKGFTIGVVDSSNVLFFVSIAVFFLALTTLGLERRKWN